MISPIISIDKTKYLIIHTAQRSVAIEGSLEVNGSSIEYVPSFTFLGVSIDNHINWKAHIEQVRKRIAPKVGIISQLRHFVPKSTLLLLYNSLILPHISYCLEIWGHTNSSFLNPILLLQKKIVRLITFSDYRAHSAPLFKQLGILDINNLCTLHTCTFIFDLINNKFAHGIHHYLEPLPHDYETRQSTNTNFYIPKVKLTLSKHNLKYAATKQWNALPTCIKSIHSMYLFKTKLKEYLHQL